MNTEFVSLLCWLDIEKFHDLNRSSHSELLTQPRQLREVSMAPVRPGGRPRNAWNPSRRRKLIRLYTLTTLNKKEIQAVLAEDGFNPR